jgi:hypothetical protein
MNDAERMRIVSDVYERMKRQRSLVEYYTRKNISVSYLRARKRGDTAALAKLYGSSEQRYW